MRRRTGGAPYQYSSCLINIGLLARAVVGPVVVVEVIVDGMAIDYAKCRLIDLELTTAPLNG